MLKYSLLLPGQGWLTISSGIRLRADGRFHAAGDPGSLRTITAAGRRYLVDRMLYGYGHYLDDYLWAQKLVPGAALSTAWQSRVGHYWLAVNEQPDSDTYTYDGSPVLAVGDVPGFSNQAIVSTNDYGTQVIDTGESDDLGLMFLHIPIGGSSQQNDVVVEDHSGEEWIRFNSTVYRPADGVAALAEGADDRRFRRRGLHRVARLAGGGRPSISAGTAWYLYDAPTSTSSTAARASRRRRPRRPARTWLSWDRPARAATVTVAPADPGHYSQAALSERLPSAAAHAQDVAALAGCSLMAHRGSPKSVRRVLVALAGASLVATFFACALTACGGNAARKAAPAPLWSSRRRHRRYRSRCGCRVGRLPERPGTDLSDRVREAQARLPLGVTLPAGIGLVQWHLRLPEHR